MKMDVQDARRPGRRDAALVAAVVVLAVLVAATPAASSGESHVVVDGGGGGRGCLPYGSRRLLTDRASSGSLSCDLKMFVRNLN